MTRAISQEVVLASSWQLKIITFWEVLDELTVALSERGGDHGH
ncbi:hypothetical protein RHAB21_03736 [Pseudorhizobium halotolerans]|uniref:Uncharacterized protein n=1 Tax=Pseudorhizobium halotolerans TaxID=1233081 RepID=A0ABM8PT44_9HYPH|nr:hypothetical protein RHAB21_03736 [Pseudorhizobium halotolerans]